MANDESGPAWYAHSTEDGDRSRWEPLAVHLRAVGRRARDFASAFGAGDLGDALGLLHDIGKYDPNFLRRLAGENVRHDHSTAGAVIATDLYQKPPIGKLLAYAVAGHHAGLANGVRDERVEGARSSLEERLKNGAAKAKAVLSRAKADGIDLPTRLEVPALKPVPARYGFTCAFFTRMLFSCLVDADFLETERFYAEAGEIVRERPVFPPLTALRDCFDAFHEREIAPRAEHSEINRLRARVLKHVRAQAARPPGVFTLTIPTGGGKTLISFAFALDHAIRHGLDRLIYVIPFTSIIEQTVDIFRGALAPHVDAVLEHHSAFDETKLQGREARDKLRLAMENWDAPVVVTTAVQFFESLFADRPARCRKLHNLARSVIVLDEVQTLPMPLLRPCVAALDELVRNYGASVVLCTATQPALIDTGEAERSFVGGFRAGTTHELAPDVSGLFTVLRRVTVEYAGAMTDEELAEQLCTSDQALCIVNTRAHARALFERIREQAGARHLSTLMCAAHRREVLAGIKSDLAAGRPCRVVATSLVEAGVDLDFPVVFRAEAGFDSIAQAAGRCNREGRRDRAASRTIVFEPETPQDTLKGLRPYADAARSILRQGGDPLMPDAIQAYFQQVYWRLGDDALDQKKILRRCEDGVSSFHFPFESIARDFRMIEDRYRAVIVPFGDAAMLIQELEEATFVGATARKLQLYTVGIPEGARRQLLASGAARVVAPERFEEQFVWVTNSDLYRPDVGLDAHDPVYREVAGLIA